MGVWNIQKRILLILLLLALGLLNTNQIVTAIDPPVIESWFFDDAIRSPSGELELTPGTTTIIYCNGTASESGTYRKLYAANGVLYHSSSSLGGSDDNNIHYTDSDCRTPTFETNGHFSCQFPVQFFAEPGTWTCLVNITVDPPKSYFTSDSNTSIMQEMLAIELENSNIGFGEYDEGEDSGTTDTTVIVKNAGNVIMDLNLDTYHKNIDDDIAMNCSIRGNLSVSQVKYSLNPGVDFTTSKIAIPAIGSTTITDFDLAEQTSPTGTQPTTKNTYWGIGIPDPGPFWTCKGKILFTAISG